MPPLRGKTGETWEERVLRKASEIRTALIDHSIVISPDPKVKLAELPPERQNKWIKLAELYVELF